MKSAIYLKSRFSERSRRGRRILPQHSNPKRPAQQQTSFEGGIPLVEDSTVHDGSDSSTRVSFDPGLRLDLRVGGTFTNGFGLDVDLGFIYNQMIGNQNGWDLHTFFNGNHQL